jgi:MoaA/NifB/PqqE/SkfB family radical SAM enzyme
MPNRMVWHINDYCNFGCSYCFFPKFDKENPAVGRLSPQQIFQAFKNTGRDWHLFIAGGEPFLYPNFIELINLLKPNNPIQISTNLYNKNVTAFAEQVTPENIIVINASLHILHHNDTSLKKFLKNYHLFLDMGFDILVSYVTYPPLFKRIRQDFEFLKEEGVKYALPLTYKGVYEGKQYPGNYTYEQIKTISDIYQEPLELLVTLDKMDFYNKMCIAGKNYFYMDLHGDVTRCVTIREPYGNLYDGTFKPNDVATPCTVHACQDHCHGIMSLLEDVEPPVIEDPEYSLFGKGYSLISDAIKLINPSRPPKKLKAESRKSQKEFVRIFPE